MIKRLICCACMLSMVLSTFAQLNTAVADIQPDAEFDNVHVKKIHTDGVSTTFVIWVIDGVKSHKHEAHTEQLYVLEGGGEMKVDDLQFVIKPGQWVLIPMGSWHSVKVTSGVPLKVLSFQAPEFQGKDRIWQEELKE